MTAASSLARDAVAPGIAYPDGGLWSACCACCMTLASWVKRAHAPDIYVCGGCRELTPGAAYRAERKELRVAPRPTPPVLRKHYVMRSSRVATIARVGR